MVGAAGCEGSPCLAKGFANPVCVSSIPAASTFLICTPLYPGLSRSTRAGRTPAQQRLDGAALVHRAVSLCDLQLQLLALYSDIITAGRDLDVDEHWKQTHDALIGHAASRSPPS